MLFNFIFAEGVPDEPRAFSEDTEPSDNLNGLCFLQGGNLRCRECPWSGLCDWQDSYEYESEGW